MNDRGKPDGRVKTPFTQDGPGLFDDATTAEPTGEEQLELDRDELIKKSDALMERMDIGAVKIEEARAKGQDVTNWESAWIGLLRQYEKLQDKVRQTSYEIAATKIFINFKD
ncbi:MAG: hypothetical protein H0X33_13465 [Taibaiella sp.]|nr:hypothetical protein [Taibaiella sp.]